MQSTVHLYNTALARLGGDNLTLLISPQEQSTIGRICETVFPHVLDLTLAAFAWSFAVRRKILASPALEKDEANPDYPFAFELPADCVKPLRLEGRAGVNRFPAHVIEGNTLCCALTPAVLVYVFRARDPKSWPPLFADALAWGLAGELAAAVNNDSQKQQWCYQNHRVSLADAIAVDKRNQNPRENRSEWTAARFGEGAF